MAGKTAVLSVKIVSDSKKGVSGLLKTANAVSVLEKAAGRSRKALAGMAKDAPKIAAGAAGIAALTATASAGVGGVLALGAGVVAVGGAALALPGIFAGGAAAIGVWKMAMADAGTVLADLVPKFQNLQQNVSAEFWERAAGPIRTLTDQLLPTLNTGLTNTARIMGGGLATAAEAVGASLGPVLGTMLSDINIGLHNATAGIQPFIAGLVEMTRIGTTYLPAVGTGLANLGKSFGAWVAQSSASGQMNAWIDNGVAALRLLGSATADTIGILGGLANAAMNAGAGGLGAFAEGLDRINTAVNGPVFQGALTTFFEGAFQGVSNLMPGVSALGSAFVALAPTLSEVMALGSSAISALVEGLAGALSSPALSGGLEQAFNGILLAAQVLSPAITALGPLVGQIAATFGTVLAAVAPLVGQLVSALAPALTTVLAAVTPVITQLVDALAPVITSLATEIVPALVPVLVTAAETLGVLVTAVAPLVSALVTALVPAIQAVLPIVQTVFQAIQPIITSALEVITGAVKVLTGILTGDWSMAWEGAQQVASGAMTLVQSVISGAMTVVGTVVQAGLQLVGNVFQTVWSGVKSLVSSALAAVVSYVVSGLSRVASGVSSGMQSVVSFFRSAWSTAKSVVSSAWSSLVSTVSSGVGRVMGFVGSLPGKIVGALSALGGQLYTVGVNMMQGMLNGIRNMAGNLIGAAKDAVGGAINAAKSLLGIHSPSRVFRKMGTQTGQGFVLGLEKMNRKVLSATKDMLEIPSTQSMSAPKLQVNAGASQRAQAGAGAPTVNVYVQGAIVDELGFQEAIARAFKNNNRLMGV